MSNYRRNHVNAAYYFFTINLLHRHQNTVLIDQIDLLRDVVKRVKEKHPFDINGWVILPDHMHCMWTLPDGDDDYSLRIRLIKTFFSKDLPDIEKRTTVRQRKGERGIWQRRFWD